MSLLYEEILNEGVLRPNSSVIMESIKDSPVLQKAKMGTWEWIDQGLTGQEWVKFGSPT